MSTKNTARREDAQADAHRRGQWTVADVAERLGTKPSTVRSYVSRGQMPEPDGRMASVMWWWPETITTWQEQRRGQGWRKGEVM